MKVAKTRAELVALLHEIRGEKLVGFVPTMGGLHEGHISLVERSLRECEITVVSVFLNPTQFNDPNDLKTYPHNTEEDLKLLEDVGVHVVFLPTPEDMYDEGEVAPDYDLGRVAEVMEGAYRPGHFKGVVWVVSKLFRLVRPNKAYFGLKDFQQIAVIRRMVELSPDMEGIEVISCPVVRESDGLAMSSRNRKLSPEQREAAPKIYEALRNGLELKAAGKRVAEVHQAVVEEINAHPMLEVEYFSIVDTNTLENVEEWGEDTTGCITVYCGGVRLIDHISFS
ncbi:pantoate--beta-alanine ligase [Porphyromonas levii]|uniref:pantoate--beta-alanine ligase n=1 Tax=Porphyromonas levii TaxID=28114 RepID=UPI000362BE84|nr:pantoate--beta-alanine ligase [Porphyromonas levii]MBR8702825.1 Pantothenate synthetase [Porphyromonas levii]MBR8712379.1 Pantothenate synthetase [Porphyromonas levii]MBR8714450.1 Pantothenate synthetase [Porphyromonas levii]MBR8726991.1 Pantothenate synthetase [Porphyromonas levii]MBR8735218.1 Pantothenate synthetase [Porphyromonas levii]